MQTDAGIFPKQNSTYFDRFWRGHCVDSRCSPLNGDQIAMLINGRHSSLLHSRLNALSL